MEAVKNTYRDAAHYYICKPVDFSHLKKVIYEALTLITKDSRSIPLQENFIITGESIKIPDSNEG